MASFGFFEPTSHDLRSHDVWADFGRLRSELDRAFERHGARGSARRGPFPAVNLYETTDGYVLTAEIPGSSREDLDVSVEGSRVTLSGKRSIELPKGASVHRRERQEGSFRRTVDLSAPLDAEKAEATYRHGVLRVRVPKAASHQPRRISVASS
jgi:HSP20 family protein